MSLKPVAPPPGGELLKRAVGADPSKFVELYGRLHGTPAAPTGKYLHWDRLIHLTPPNGLTHEQWWLGIKMAREPLFRVLPLSDANGNPFVFAMTDEALELLHHIDQHAAGEIAMPEVVTEGEAAKNQYLVNSLIEEAIRSSQLEGANTTRKVAKEMIRSGRPPRDRSERMILNNFRAMEFMHETGDRLSPETVLTLHSILTTGTLDNEDAAGRLQRPDEERVVVWHAGEGELLHQPPPAEQLKERLDLMCQFANGEIGVEGFLHPVVRSILVHFWLAYDHPFEDGNGRTARALFYWAMRTQGYWLTEYLSISRILRMAPAKYSNAFLFTESDDRDSTYFILYHLNIIKRAINELQTYLQRKMREIRDFESLIRKTDGFNHRQLALLRNAVRESHQRYTFRSHGLSHKVSFQTARTDLLQLNERGFLNLRRVGRRFVFTPAPDLVERLKSPA